MGDQNPPPGPIADRNELEIAKASLVAIIRNTTMSTTARLKALLNACWTSNPNIPILEQVQDQAQREAVVTFLDAIADEFARTTLDGDAKITHLHVVIQDYPPQA